MIRERESMTELQKCTWCGWDSAKEKTHKEWSKYCAGNTRPSPSVKAEEDFLANGPYSFTTEVRSTSSTGGQKGVKPERYDLIPTEPLRLLATHYGIGAQKYAPHQWRKGFEWGKAYTAANRHMNQFWAGEDYDICPVNPESEDGYGGPGCIMVNPETKEPVVRHIPGIGRACYNHTGSLHLVNAIWMLMALVEFYHTHPEHDDRHKPSAA